MALRSCLDERPAPVVADTSVVINLHATGDGEAILGALPNRCVIVEDVSRELEAGRRTGRGDAGALGVLIEQQLVEHAQLGDVGISRFADLVGGAAADTLDDGEAATIACAMERSAIALIDDRKAIRLCAERFPHLAVGCTLDVLAQQHVQAAFGHRLVDAVFNALDRGRMRVPERYGPSRSSGRAWTGR
ncbi:MAG: hypothetical protein OXH69_22335 [Acidobacteria bacterium]|nr:hypothetical protein [Acidobacteriota bacterium]